ncbi:MAG: adenylyl-sulfate kinase [Castellaniella sp.]|uniref:adenylyl-sulfate kinase n=1 Tax=Castellaniella sp. TaxID=1955812 RepID=UPI003C78DDDF
MNGRTIWITGLSGAGKSTLSAILVSKLRAIEPKTIFLDGDELREVLAADSRDGSHHDRNQRLALATRYARLCRLLASQGFTVVIATISLFREIHDWNRENQPGYFEIYLKVPLEELRRRDPKGIYHRHAAGEVHNVAGLDFSIDEPAQPEILIEFNPSRSPDETAEYIFLKLMRENQ